MTGVLKDKYGNELFPATTAEQVAHGETNAADAMLNLQSSIRLLQEALHAMTTKVALLPSEGDGA